MVCTVFNYVSLQKRYLKLLMKLGTDFEVPLSSAIEWVVWAVVVMSGAIEWVIWAAVVMSSAIEWVVWAADDLL
jgi:hypothetical protein